MMPPSGFVPPRSSLDAPKSFVLLSVLRPYVQRYRWMVALLLVALLVDSAVTTLIPFATGFAIDHALLPPNYGLLFRLFLFCGAGMLVGAGFAIMRDYLYARLGSHVRNDIQSDMLAHIHRLSARYHARVPQGDILARFTNDLATLDNSLVLNLPAVIICGLVVLINATFLFVVEWRLAIVAAIGLLLSLAGPRLLAPKASAYGRELRVQEARALTLIQQDLSVHELIRAYGLEKARFGAFLAQLSNVFRSSVRFNFTNNLVGRTPVISIGFLQIGLFSFGAYWTARGSISIGSLTSFLLFFNNVLTAVSEVSYSVPTLIHADAGARRIRELLREAPEIRDASGAKPLEPVRRAIHVDHVSFGYHADDLALVDVDAELAAHTLHLIAGPSGAGKSTLLRLLLRLDDPTSGAVRFDGVNLREVLYASLRRQIGVVFQDELLFPGTIRDNILAGRDDIGQDALLAVARRVELHEEIERLPNKYDTFVSGDGPLSAAQRQRIALARALVGEPTLLLLDQATSAFEPAAEARLWSTLRALRAKCTIVATASNLRVAPLCDHVLVLDRGRTIDAGTHDELVARCGVYRTLLREPAPAVPPSDRSTSEAP